MPRDNNLTRTYYYKIDVEGRVWHDKSPIDDPSALKIFFKFLEKTEKGIYVSLCQGETNYFEAEDVPIIIHEIKIKKDKIKIYYQGNLSENLDPETLFVGKKNVLYCLVKERSLTARFNRQAYLDLAKEITFDKNSRAYSLKIGAKEFRIKGVKD